MDRILKKVVQINSDKVLNQGQFGQYEIFLQGQGLFHTGSNYRKIFTWPSFQRGLKIIFPQVNQFGPGARPVSSRYPLNAYTDKNEHGARLQVKAIPSPQHLNYMSQPTNARKVEVRSESKGEALRNTMIRLHLCDYKSSKFSF